MKLDATLQEECAGSAGPGPEDVAAAPPDPRALRRALGRYATGVTVVTARAPGPAGAPVGVTANSFTSVSLEPPLLLWCLDLRSSTRPVFLAAGWFAVNVLAADQAALSVRFATPGGADKFAGLGWAEGLGGSPLLPGCLARFECRTERAVEAGDHVVLIGRVLRASHREEGEPLLFLGGRYRLPGPPLAAARGEREGA
ncbi:flavin reductase family protein [Caldovatus aquaticus]|uniref:Flavin reductase family protein n=1 Tax=Caldovatus aquaticus TaxID=2865671 RepID=A0ABS7EXN4_9PROT|nr:flavin reductase family protein [Caldovatus aquaticus]MBW8267994.1 flavin reductase family protein [Caldovatus aquaticus]